MTSEFCITLLMENCLLRMHDLINYQWNFTISWTGNLWNQDIPPSRAFTIWGICHNRLAVNDNLLQRGCIGPSCCSLCYLHDETISHLFFQCSFSHHIWHWLLTMIKLLKAFDVFKALKICDKNWSKQCKVTIQVAIIYILNTIWTAINNMRFKNYKMHW